MQGVTSALILVAARALSGALLRPGALSQADARPASDVVLGKWRRGANSTSLNRSPSRDTVWTFMGHSRNGKGLHHGASTDSLRRGCSRLANGGAHGQAGLLLAAAVGKTWPGADLRGGHLLQDDETDICPRCKLEDEPDKHRIWTCPHNAALHTGISECVVCEAVLWADAEPVFWLRGMLTSNRLEKPHKAGVTRRTCCAPRAG
eukprot:NODE_14578_length_1100_cov_2.255910.p1 GENE.NODE_14578_length_1100_cov_2.255910~~NODE_14578_length_1100_cov_2.255910.p1  ORF type:complete len:205 (+),score=31.31 NODE_14578_length_1100_cov_2.255910:311-925(+)